MIAASISRDALAPHHSRLEFTSELRAAPSSRYSPRAYSRGRSGVEPPAGVSSRDDEQLPLNEGGASVSPPVKPLRARLTLLPLVGILFANCCGSGYGFEPAIGGGGPLATLVMCNILPWLWALPTGLAVAELSSSMPSNAGSLVWINAAFPPFVSFANIITSTAISCLCNASYASLTGSYLLGFAYGRAEDAPRIVTVACRIGAVIVCLVLNIIGVELVGAASVFAALITLAPFIGITLGGFIRYPLNIGALTAVPRAPDWSQFFSIVTWNYSNVDSVGNIVEEVADAKNLSRAMPLVMLLTYVAYFLPTIAGVDAAVAQRGYSNSDWVVGYWGDVAGFIGGQQLRDFLLFGAIVSGMGYLMTGLCFSSRQLAGTGDMDAFPDRVSQFLAHLHRRFGTPVHGLLLHAAAAAVLCSLLSFDSLVAVNQVLYCTRLSFVYIAAVRLRVTHPNLRRPFRFPVRRPWLFGACMLTALIVSIGTAVMAAAQNWVVALSSASFVLGSVAVSILYCRTVRPLGFRGCIVRDDGETVPAAEA